MEFSEASPNSTATSHFSLAFHKYVRKQSLPSKASLSILCLRKKKRILKIYPFLYFWTSKLITLLILKSSILVANSYRLLWFPDVFCPLGLWGQVAHMYRFVSWSEERHLAGQGKDQETDNSKKLKFRCLFIHTDTSRAVSCMSTVCFANTEDRLSYCKQTLTPCGLNENFSLVITRMINFCLLSFWWYF